MSDDNVCQICYEKELSPENAMIICWNSHVICNDCCNRIYTGRLDIKCPFDRGEMFDWRPRRVSTVESAYLDADLCPRYRRSVYTGPTTHRIYPRMFVCVDRDDTISMMNIRPMCSCCGTQDHSIRHCPFKGDEYINHPIWVKLNKNKINKLKRELKTIIGKKYTDYKNEQRADLVPPRHGYKWIVRELHREFGKKHHNCTHVRLHIESGN